MSLGAAIGYLMGRVRLADRLGDPWLILLLNLPALVVIVLAYIWAGLTEVAAIAAIAINKLPTAVVTLREGTRALDRSLDEMATVFAIPRWRAFRHVVLPQLAPYIAAAARSGLSLVWKIVLVAELLGRPNGVGFEIGVAFQLFDIPLLLAYSLTFAAVVLVIETVLVQPFEMRAIAVAAPCSLRSISSSKKFRERGRRTRTTCWPASTFALRSRRGRRVRRPIRLRQEHHAARFSPASITIIRDASRARPVRGSAWCSRSRGCCRGARSKKMCGLPRLDADEAKLSELFTILELTAHRSHFPGELSLGLARRVALARAFAIEPDFLILDEPLASLDDALAARLREQIATLVGSRSVMTLLVTHNLDDAVRLGDRLLLLSPRPAKILADLPIRIAAQHARRSRDRCDQGGHCATDQWRSLRPRCVIGSAWDAW